MSVDLVDIRMPPERRGIDRFEDFHDDFRGQRQIRRDGDGQPKREPDRHWQDLHSNLVEPQKMRESSATTEEELGLLGAIETIGTIGTPVSIAVRA